MKIATYKDAVKFARIAGEDAANRQMRKAGRAAWDEGDWDLAADTMSDFLVSIPEIAFSIAPRLLGPATSNNPA